MSIKKITLKLIEPGRYRLVQLTNIIQVVCRINEGKYGTPPTIKDFQVGDEVKQKELSSFYRDDHEVTITI